MDQQEPRLFETLTLPNVAALCFVIRVADSKIKPELVPTPGTAYSACLLPTRTAVQEWGTYVYGFPQEAPAGYSAYVFLPALPTAPVVATRQDEIWGPVLDHSYYALRSAGIPDIADTNVTALGTPGNGRFVQRVQIQEVSSLVALITVTTTAAATVTQTDKPVDLTSGSLYTRTKTYTLAATTPTGSAPDTAGQYTTVTQQSHKTFLSVTDKASTLPNSRATAITWDSHDKMYWPAVLQSHEFINVLKPDLETLKKLLTTNLRSPYSGDCKVTSRLWWQSTPYDVGEVNALIGSGINIRGNFESFAVPDCLHGPLTYEEPNVRFYDAQSAWYGTVVTSDLVVLQFNYSATALTEWPATIVTARQRFVNGGYEILEETYHRPPGYGTADSTVTERPWNEFDGRWFTFQIP
jgi:hypothetical protein